MTTRRRQRNSSGNNLLSKDPYGLVWLSLLFLLVMVVKWWVISPENREAGNCVACAVAIVWLLSVIVHLVLVFFWIVWSKKYQKGTAFVMFLSLFCLLLAGVDYVAVEFIVGKLFFSGALNWQESQASELIDVFVPHSIALLLVSSIMYSMIRVFFSRDLADKKLVYIMAAVITLSVAPMYFLGLIAY